MIARALQSHLTSHPRLKVQCDTRTRIGSDNEVLAPLVGVRKMKHRVREASQRTIDDHNIVHAIDNELRSELGDLYNDLSRGSIYRRIAERLPRGYEYCEKRIAFILNHTKMSEVPTT